MTEVTCSKCKQVLCECGHLYRSWPTNRLEALLQLLEAERVSRFTLDPAAGQETPQEEGARLRAAGRGLSCLWGDVSEANFGQFDQVLEGYLGPDYKEPIRTPPVDPTPKPHWVRRFMPFIGG